MKFFLVCILFTLRCFLQGSGATAKCTATFDMRAVDQVERTYDQQTQAETESTNRMTVAYVEVEANTDVYIDPSKIPSDILSQIPSSLKGRLFSVKEYYALADALGANHMISQILSMLVRIEVGGCDKNDRSNDGDAGQNLQCDQQGSTKRRRLSTVEKAFMLSEYEKKGTTKTVASYAHASKLAQRVAWDSRASSGNLKNRRLNGGEGGMFFVMPPFKENVVATFFQYVIGTSDSIEADRVENAYMMFSPFTSAESSAANGCKLMVKLEDEAVPEELVKVDGVLASCLEGAFTGMNVVPGDMLGLNIFTALSLTTGAAPGIDEDVAVVTRNATGHEQTRYTRSTYTKYRKLQSAVKAKQMESWKLKCWRPYTNKWSNHDWSQGPPTPSPPGSCSRDFTRVAGVKKAAYDGMVSTALKFVAFDSQFNIETGKENKDMKGPYDWNAHKAGSATCRVSIQGLVDVNGNPLCSEELVVENKPPECNYYKMQNVTAGISALLRKVKLGEMAASADALISFTGQDTWFSCSNLILDTVKLEEGVEVTEETSGCTHPFPKTCGDPMSFCRTNEGQSDPWCTSPCCNWDLMNKMCCMPSKQTFARKKAVVLPIKVAEMCMEDGSVDMATQAGKVASAVMNGQAYIDASLSPEACFTDKKRKSEELAKIDQIVMCCYDATIGEMDQSASIGGIESTQKCTVDKDCYTGKCKRSTSQGGNSQGSNSQGGNSQGGNSQGGGGSQCWGNDNTGDNKCELASASEAGPALAKCIVKRMKSLGMLKGVAFLRKIFANGDLKAPIATIGNGIVNSASRYNCQGQSGWKYDPDNWCQEYNQTAGTCYRNCEDETSCQPMCTAQETCNHDSGKNAGNCNGTASKTHFCAETTPWGSIEDRTEYGHCNVNDFKLITGSGHVQAYANPSWTSPYGDSFPLLQDSDCNNIREEGATGVALDAGTNAASDATTLKTASATTVAIPADATITITGALQTVDLSSGAAGSDGTTLSFSALVIPIPGNAAVTVHGKVVTVSLQVSAPTPTSTTLNLKNPLAAGEEIPANAKLTITALSGKYCKIQGTVIAAHGTKHSAGDLTVTLGASLPSQIFNTDHECQITFKTTCDSAGTTSADSTGAAVSATSVTLASTISAASAGNQCQMTYAAPCDIAPSSVTASGSGTIPGETSIPIATSLTQQSTLSTDRCAISWVGKKAMAVIKNKFRYWDQSTYEEKSRDLLTCGFEGKKYGTSMTVDKASCLDECATTFAPTEEYACTFPLKPNQPMWSYEECDYSSEFSGAYMWAEQSNVDLPWFVPRPRWCRYYGGFHDGSSYVQDRYSNFAAANATCINSFGPSAVPRLVRSKDAKCAEDVCFKSGITENECNNYNQIWYNRKIGSAFNSENMGSQWYSAWDGGNGVCQMHANFWDKNTTDKRALCEWADFTFYSGRSFKAGKRDTAQKCSAQYCNLVGPHYKFTSEQCDSLPGQCDQWNCKGCQRNWNAYNNAPSSKVDYGLCYNVTDSATCSADNVDKFYHTAGGFCYTKGKGSTECTRPWKYIEDCMDLPFAACSGSSGSAVDAALNTLLVCKQSGHTQCKTKAECESAGECWGGLSSQYWLPDANGNWEGKYYMNVCVKDKTTKEGEFWPSCTEYKQGCTEGQGWCHDDYVHEMHKTCVDLRVNTSSWCTESGGTWTSTSQTKSQCLAPTQCQTLGGWRDEKSAAECSKCGGKNVPMNQWNQPTWTTPAMVSSSLTWNLRRMESKNTWVQNIDKWKVNDLVRNIKNTMLQEVNGAFTSCLYAKQGSALTKVAASCGSVKPSDAELADILGASFELASVTAMPTVSETAGVSSKTNLGLLSNSTTNETELVIMESPYVPPMAAEQTKRTPSRRLMEDFGDFLLRVYHRADSTLTGRVHRGRGLAETVGLNAAACYTQVTNDAGFKIGQLVGNCIEISLPAGKSFLESPTLCIEINAAIEILPAFDTKDFASKNGTVYRPLAISVSQAGKHYCGAIPTAGWYCPVSRVSAYASVTADKGSGKCTALENIVSSVEKAQKCRLGDSKSCTWFAPGSLSATVAAVGAGVIVGIVAYVIVHAYCCHRHRHVLKKHFTKAFFAKEDLDGDGILEANEIQKMAKDEFGAEMTIDQCRALIGQYDTKGLGGLDMAEYQAMMNNLRLKDEKSGKDCNMKVILEAIVANPTSATTRNQVVPVVTI
jgi:hypothetical protein